MAKNKKKATRKAQDSGIGLTLAEMSDVQFKRHLSRVLNRMGSHNATKEDLTAAEKRIIAKRSLARQAKARAVTT